MGILSFFQRRAERKNAEAAAEYIYGLLLTGMKLEVPAYLSTDNPTAQAILVLRERHPDVACTMLQSKSLVLMRVNVSKAAMTNDGWKVLDAHGYFPEGQLPAQAFLAAHEAFMRRNDIDPAQVEREGEAARRVETAVAAGPETAQALAESARAVAAQAHQVAQEAQSVAEMVRLEAVSDPMGAPTAEEKVG